MEYDQDGTIVIYCTASPDQAQDIANDLVRKHLVACVNIASVDSIYEWKGEPCADQEALMIMKTAYANLEKVVRRIRDLHNYELPEIIALPVIGGYSGYLEWVQEVVRASR